MTHIANLKTQAMVYTHKSHNMAPVLILQRANWSLELNLGIRLTIIQFKYLWLWNYMILSGQSAILRYYKHQIFDPTGQKLYFLNLDDHKLLF